MLKNFIFSLMVMVIVPSLIVAQSPNHQKIQATVLQTPDSSVKYAAGDLSTLPPEIQPYIRYLSLYNVSKNERKNVAINTSFVLNSLSRHKKIRIPVFVGASDESVIRVNLKDYDIDPKIWDLLGLKGSGPKPFPEPYFHATAIKIEQENAEQVVRKVRKVFTGYYVQGRNGLEPQYREEEYDEVVKVEGGKQNRVKVIQNAPWVDPVAITALCAGTKSEYPIYRADWFNTFSMVEPIYHQFLDLGETDKTFAKAVFADEKLAEQARSKTKAVVIKSSVAANIRTLQRSPTFTDGYYWESHDTLKSTDDRNYIQNVLDEKFDAKEIIASLPNGLQTYFVTDGEGKRVDKADGEIAVDHMSHDKIVRNGRSCIYCHSSGILPIQDEVRTLNKKLTNRDQVKLLVANEKDYYRIEDLFGTNIDKRIVKDQQIYADAVAEATGLTPQSMAALFYDQWEGYIEKLLTKEQIAREFSLTVTELEKYCKLSNDPMILGLTMTPIRPVRRDQFEQGFQTFMLIIMQAKKQN